MDLCIDSVLGWVVMACAGVSSLGVPGLFAMHAAGAGRGTARVAVETLLLVAATLTGVYLGVAFAEDYAPSLRGMVVAPLIGAFLLGQGVMLIIMAIDWCAKQGERIKYSGGWRVRWPLAV